MARDDRSQRGLPAALPHRPEPTAAIEALEGADDEQVLATVERVDLHAALNSLEEADRKLLMLRYAEDLTEAAIARLLEYRRNG